MERFQNDFLRQLFTIFSRPKNNSEKRSGKNILKFLHAGNFGDYFPLLHKSAQNNKFSNEIKYFPARKDFKIDFSRPLFTIIF